jgi:low affinity Fe/Cu permease
VFSQWASAVARAAGHPFSFSIAVLCVVVWGLTGPLFSYSDTWQLVINTGTTIITFLMVFLVQHTQNKDAVAVQLKLSELVRAIEKADNRVATAEELTSEELEELRQQKKEMQS